MSLSPVFVAEQFEIGGSELVASLIPGDHVIKAFDNMYGRYVAANPVTEAGRRILFYTRATASLCQGTLPVCRRGFRIRTGRPRPASDGALNAGGRRTSDGTTRYPFRPG